MNMASETPQSEITVRPAQEHDLQAIVQFNLQLARETEDLTLDEATVSAGVAAVLDDPTRGRYLLAFSDNHPIGQLMQTWEWSDWRNGFLWWLQSVYVDPPYRRQGVFRALWNQLLKQARQDGNVVGIRLYVEEFNRPAQAVYERLGLRLCGYHVMEQVPLDQLP